MFVEHKFATGCDSCKHWRGQVVNSYTGNGTLAPSVAYDDYGRYKIKAHSPFGSRSASLFGVPFAFNVRVKTSALPDRQQVDTAVFQRQPISVTTTHYFLVKFCCNMRVQQLVRVRGSLPACGLRPERTRHEDKPLFSRDERET